jgi:phosphoglycerate dehydrogenase-like enzyme
VQLETAVEARREWPAGFVTDAEVLYLAGSVPRPEQAPRLRWLHSHWAGTDHLQHSPMWDSNILLTTSSGIHAPNIGQYVMAQMLAWSNRVPRWLHHQQQSNWPSGRWERFVPDELRGKTVGIAGYGSLGREVARLASAFGMTVLATKRNPGKLQDEGLILDGIGDPAGDLPARVFAGEETQSMVAECDYVIITLPLTEHTRHLFDKEMFRAMKRHAYLINVGRGAVIKTEDLISALHEGWIGGAGLDVFETEPLPVESPLWQMENVIISPHVSGFTPLYDERATDLFAQNLQRYLAGAQLLNVVSRSEGY